MSAPPIRGTPQRAASLPNKASAASPPKPPPVTEKAAGWAPKAQPQRAARGVDSVFTE